MGGQSVPGRRMRMRKGRELSSLVGAVNVGFYVINLKFIPVLAAPSVASDASMLLSVRRNRLARAE